MVETPPPPSPPHYFVTVSSLALREGPTTAATQIGTLEFNDAVELLDTSSGWGRVVDVRRDRTGWASMRYLQPMPANRPQSVPRKRSTPAPELAPTPGSGSGSQARRIPQGHVGAVLPGHLREEQPPSQAAARGYPPGPATA